MNYRQRELENHKLLNQLRFTSRKEGYVKIHSHNSLPHELVKFQIAYKLKKQKYLVYSEVEFIKGGKADLVAIKEGNGWIIEVLHSETEKQLSEKVKKYPNLFSLIKVNTQDFKVEKFEL